MFSRHEKGTVLFDAACRHNDRVFPRGMASRTSIHVSSSINTESFAAIRRGDSGSGFTGSGIAEQKLTSNTADKLSPRDIGIALRVRFEKMYLVRHYRGVASLL